MYWVTGLHEEDAETLLYIYAPFVLETPTTFEYLVPSIGEWKERLRNIAARFPFLVLRDESGKAVGYAYASEHRSREAYKWAVESSIYLAQSARGKGLGKKLYTLLLREIAANGFKVVYGVISLPNEASIKLHEKVGFKWFATFPKAGFKMQRWHDVAWLRAEVNQFEEAPDAPNYQKVALNLQLDED